MKSSPLYPRRFSAFALVEMIMTTALIVMLLGILMSMTRQASGVWQTSQSKVEQFRQARQAFETMTRRLSQATLSTHWDYQYAVDDLKKERPPIAYVRQSHLRFRSGPMERLAPGEKPRPGHGIFFQAPLGASDEESLDNLDRLLNSVGYFLEVSDDRDERPTFLRNAAPPRIRYRLMEMRNPSEKLGVFQLDPDKQDDTWIQKAVDGEARPVRVIAENIVALVIQPALTQPEEERRALEGKKPLCPKYEYDSVLTSNHEPPPNPPDPEINPHHQLPPVVRLVMFAVDDLSARRLQKLAPSDPTLGLDTSTLFKNSKDLEQDLAAFERQLQAKDLNYRIFSTAVSLRGAKWSRSQTL